MSPSPGSGSAVVEEAEVVVVGGGPTGSLAAATLAELGRDVLVVDQSEFPREKPCGDGLTHSAVGVLEELGLRSLAGNAQPVEDCRIVIAHGAEMKGWYRPPDALPGSRFMRTLPRDSLDKALLDAALERGARFLRARVDGPVLEGETARGVRLASPDDDRRVDARCVIAADGATSRMRRASGIGGDVAGTQVYAARQYLSTAEPLDPVFDVYVPLTYEGGILAGYGWVFPIAERRANVGVAYYSPPAGRPRARIRRVLSSFVRELEEREVDRFGALTEPSRPIGAPIAVHFSPRRCQLGNVLFAGEAALAADPLTGEGISFAMRSGRSAAHVADRLLRSERAPRIGPLIGRQFPRLGQNLGLLARVAASAGEGFRLAEREHQPFVLAVRRVTGSVPDEPTLEPTEVRGVFASDAELDDALERVNERLLDALRTSFPFGLETLHREVRARGGPVAAACALAVARSGGGELDEAAISAAAAAELIAVADRCHPRVNSRVRSDLAWLNNAMALLLGDLAVAAALRAPRAEPARSAHQIGAAVRTLSEGQACETEDRYDVRRSVERCRHVMDARSGTVFRLAASLGALAGGVSVEAHGAFGRELGIAYALSEQVRELSVGDELLRRRPGSELREGFYALPVVVALALDAELSSELENGPGTEQMGAVLRRIRDSGGLEEAAAECGRHAESARDAIPSDTGAARDSLEALARFPVARVSGVVPEPGPRVPSLG